MDRKLSNIQTSKAAAAVGPYSQAVLAGGFLHVSGQLGIDPTRGKMVQGGFAAQSKQALSNLHNILLAAECEIADIVSVEVLLADIKDFQTFNQIYADFLGEHRPARAAYQVAALPLQGLVEIKCVAYKG